MNKELLFVVIVFWLTMTAYVMHWHYKRGDLSIGTTLLAIVLAPILALIIKDEIKETEREREINREGFRSVSGFSIPPPPPISRVDRAVSERDEAIRSARKRTGKNKLENFKFLKG